MSGRYHLLAKKARERKQEVSKSKPPFVEYNKEKYASLAQSVVTKWTNGREMCKYNS